MAAPAVAAHADTTEADTVSNPGTRTKVVGGIVSVAFVCVQVPPAVASALILVSALFVTYAIGLLAHPEKAPVKEAASQDELKRSLNQAKAEINQAEARRRKAVEGSTVDRDELYRLRGDLAALSGADDRVKFVLVSSDAATLSKEKTALWRQTVGICRQCEEQRLAGDEACKEVEVLRQQSRDLEIEIEATLKKRELEQANREHLDEESTKLRAQMSRLHAKITTHDASLQHARVELRSYGHGSHVDKQRLECAIAADVEKKKHEVRSEKQDQKRKQGEKHLVENVGERLFETLEERTQQVEELQQSLRQEAIDKKNVAQALQSIQQEIAKFHTEGVNISFSKVSVEEANGVVQEASAASKVSAKTKAGKSSKAKKKKECDGPESQQLEDLELERASVIATTETAEQQAKEALAAAEAKLALAKMQAGKLAESCVEIDQRQGLVTQERTKFAADKAEMEAVQEEKSVQVASLEKQIKDAERNKIRLRLDIKKLKDAEKERLNTPAKPSPKDVSGATSPQAQATSASSPEEKAQDQSILEVPLDGVKESSQSPHQCTDPSSAEPTTDSSPTESAQLESKASESASPEAVRPTA